MPDKVFSDMSLAILDRDDVEIGRIEGEWWFAFAEALARGYDREDAAQRGEPDPWSPEFPQDEHWERSRRICAFAGIWEALAPFRRNRRIRDLKVENARLRTMIRVNMLCHRPDVSHEEIDEAVDAAIAADHTLQPEATR